jgi:hypothetical protein
MTAAGRFVVPRPLQFELPSAGAELGPARQETCNDAPKAGRAARHHSRRMPPTGGGRSMKQAYESPELIEYGPIAECTFTDRPRHPGDDDEGESGFPSC